MPEYYLYFLLFTFFAFTAFKVIAIYKIKVNSNKDQLDSKDITILIPFRNEAHQLPCLLEALSKQENFTQEIIFINDHSDDNSSQQIQEFITKHKKGSLINLTLEHGKKAALLSGVEQARTKYILTLDADVILSENYITQLSQLKKHDLIALPVIMKGKSFLGKVFSVEYLFFNAFNYLISPIYPISVSGANLIYNQQFLEYSKQLEKHKHISSGDDYFLLKKVRELKGKVLVSNELKLSVETQAPESFTDYFQQRLRWLTKTKLNMTFWELLIGSFITFYFVGGFIALFISLIQLNFVLFFSIYSIRLGLDALVFIHYVQPLKQTRDILFLPVFQFVYPLLMLLVYVQLLYTKPLWKGRKVE